MQLSKKETILIAGGSGLVGSRIINLLPTDLYDIRILTRRPKGNHGNVSYWLWDTRNGHIQEGATEVDHVINLAGAGIADKRWTKSRKQELISSRVDSTHILRDAILKSSKRPRTYISASAVGYYGHRGHEILTEESHPGDEYMSKVCQLWEEAALEVSSLVERHAILRIGIVLSTRGGALPKIMMTKSLGIYTYFGNGKQYYPWIHIDDLAHLIIQSTQDMRVEGIYNAVSPEPVQNKAFVYQVMRGCGAKGIVLPTPEILLRLGLGELANVVLNSNRVIPRRLDRLKFQYRFPKLEAAASDLITRKT